MTSTGLSPIERQTLAVITAQCRQGDPVAASDVRYLMLRAHEVRYDQVNRALTNLVAKGAAIKPSRGFYLPAP